MSDDLKPCPFCGARLYACEFNGGSTRWAHEANGCAIARAFIYDKEAWNRRSGDE